MKNLFVLLTLALASLTGVSQNLLDSLQGKWIPVHMKINEDDVDCENFDSALKKQLSDTPADSLSIKKKFEIGCAKLHRMAIEIQGTNFIQQTTFSDEQVITDTIVFRLEKDTLIALPNLPTGDTNDQKFKIEFLDKNRFNQVYSENTWIEFIRKND